MAGHHDHTTAARAGHRRRLLAVFVAVVVFLVVEAVTAIATGSLALLSDAGHMLTDAAGLGMALGAMALASRPARSGFRTYGRYRLEILAAAANGFLLLGVGGYAVAEGIRRLGSPPEVATGPMLVVAAIGLLVNLGGWLVLRRPGGESLNVEGARLEVLADLIGSVAAVTAAVLIRYAGWAAADAAFGIALGAFVIPRAARLIRRALRVLMQDAPEGIDMQALRRTLAALPHVVDVHDVHAWTLTSGMEVGTAHVVVSDDADVHAALDGARAVLEQEFGLPHATVQIETASHRDCVEADW
ncbi:MAG: cation diffusion facilitator family transporter [Actinobacteria bacterium]|nr:cation diffusion facilitator family transporter [Actinomycetota bacterium]